VAHEQSETIQDKFGRWLNVFGKNTKRAGEPLKKKYSFEKETYETVEEAVEAAKRRSKEEGKERKRPKAPPLLQYKDDD
jgi:hypothetical protein